MNQIYPDEGLVDQLKLITGVTYQVCLFVNNITPDRSTVLSSLTEASYSGYTRSTVNSSDWTSSGVVGHVGYIAAPPVAIANASGTDQSAYGYFITDPTHTRILAIARFDSAPRTVHNGDSFIVTPVWGDFSGLSS
jgi:hypothetical protein